MTTQCAIPKSLILATFLAWLPAGCAKSEGFGTNAIPVMSESADEGMATAALQSGSVFISTFQAPSNVINLYVPGNANPIRTITHGFITPGHLALDPAGNLYSGNGDPRDITVYAAGSSFVLRAIRPRLNGNGWFLIGIDMSARLYALS
jgi:hypothetical protein